MENDRNKLAAIAAKVSEAECLLDVYDWLVERVRQIFTSGRDNYAPYTNLRDEIGERIIALNPPLKRVKLYIAAPYAEKQRIKQNTLPWLKANGVDVISSWLDEPDDTLGEHKTVQAAVQNYCLDAGQLVAMANRDLHEIDAADAVLVFTYPEGQGPSRGGRFVEMGYALAKGKPVFLCGQRENIFCYGVSCFDFFKNLIELPEFKRLRE